VTRLELELREQPEALARLLDRQATRAAEAAQLLRRDDVRYILIASRGSSSNAARYAQYLLGRAHRVPVAFATPSLYTHYDQPPRLDDALVVGISQSGESPDVNAVLEEARAQGRPTIALTNHETSPLARTATAVLPLDAGDEQAVAATKTYMNSLGAIALLFANSTGSAAALEELRGMPARMERQLDRSLAEEVRLDARGGTVVARGINYATAFEIALKLRELTGVLFEAYSAADLMHGPIAALGADWPVIAVAVPGPTLADLNATIIALARREARVTVIGEGGELSLVPGTPEWLTPLVAVVPGQVAAIRLARHLGRDIDRPQGLSKVTLTR
jgi:glucosamine--fructose-6-phosphate aminotransferase (isomerizing)